MQITILDFEATDKNCKEALPVSLAYLTLDDGLNDAVQSGVLYFHKPGINYDSKQYAEAQAIHGLTDGFLHQFEESYDENVSKTFTLFNKANICGYNIKGYDFNLAKYFLCREGFPAIETASTTDVMSIYRPIFKRRISLVNACAELGISDRIIKIFHKKWFGTVAEESWHSASWDVTATAMLYINAVRKGLF